MPFNGAGQFNRLRSWVADKTALIKIRADYHDSEDDGFAAGLSNTICRDGQSTITADIPFNGKKIIGLGAATAGGDALSRSAGDGRYPQLAGNNTLSGINSFVTEGLVAGAASLATDGGFGKPLMQANGTSGVNGALLLRMTGGIGGYIGFLNHSIGLVGTVVDNGSGGVLYNTTSDYRVKLNPQDLTGSGAFIDALRPRTWTWATGGQSGTGFIAHEVQEVSPSSVYGEKDAVTPDGKMILQSMQASSPEIMAHVVAELQSLRARVAVLEGV